MVVPTTLLCRQHYRTFIERFAGFPIRIAELSRWCRRRTPRRRRPGSPTAPSTSSSAPTRCWPRTSTFRDLGLLIVDEEQHFGVAHKERLKKLKTDVHVLTLTATPIPRTLQMALTGVREMSLIATPPVDRLAVRTFVLEFDPVVIREAILREHAPRRPDLLRLPAHRGSRAGAARPAPTWCRRSRWSWRTAGCRRASWRRRSAPSTSGAYDVLLSTNIIESGLDLPAVNTIVIHRADMFGLSSSTSCAGGSAAARCAPMPI